MGRGAYKIDIEAYIDSPEKIRKCLSCPLPKCNNCRSSSTRERAVIGKDRNGRILRFESISAAAEAANTRVSNICQAIRRGGRAKGILWRYEGARDGAEV